jgi:hypothetical protein
MTFAEYFKVYHWSIPETEEPVPGKVYPEPDANDEPGQRRKEDIIHKKREVRYSTSGSCHASYSRLNIRL